MNTRPASRSPSSTSRHSTRAAPTSRTHAGRLPVVLLARLGRIWEVYRPVQNVELNEFFEQRGHAASWAMLIGYYLLLPFAIGGLVVLRRRRIPIYPFLAIVAAITHHGDARLPRHPLPGVVRRGHAGARRGRARRALAVVAADAPPGGTEAAAESTRRRPANRSRSQGDATTESRRTAPSTSTSTIRSDRRRRSGRTRSFGAWLAVIAGVGLLVRLINVFWWRPTTNRPGYHRLPALGRRLLLPLPGQRPRRRASSSSTRTLALLRRGEGPSAGHPPLYTIYLALWSLFGIDSVTAAPRRLGLPGRRHRRSCIGFVGTAPRRATRSA